MTTKRAITRRGSISGAFFRPLCFAVTTEQAHSVSVVPFVLGLFCASVSSRSMWETPGCWAGEAVLGETIRATGASLELNHVLCRARSTQSPSPVPILTPSFQNLRLTLWRNRGFIDGSRPKSVPAFSLVWGCKHTDTRAGLQGMNFACEKP